jgi:hypothetical protein
LVLEAERSRLPQANAERDGKVVALFEGASSQETNRLVGDNRES